MDNQLAALIVGASGGAIIYALAILILDIVDRYRRRRNREWLKRVEAAIERKRAAGDLMPGGITWVD